MKGLTFVYKIEIEDLVANSLIELMQKKNKRFVTSEEVIKFGEKIVDILNKEEKKAILDLSRNKTYNFLYDNRNIFEQIDIDGKTGYRVKDNITVEDLIDRFRGYLALDVLLAIIEVSNILYN